MGIFPQAMFEYTLWAQCVIARNVGTGLRLMVAATRREKHPTRTLGVQTGHKKTFGSFEKRHIFILNITTVNTFFRNFGDF